MACHAIAMCSRPEGFDLSLGPHMSKVQTSQNKESTVRDVRHVKGRGSRMFGLERYETRGPHL